MATAIGRALTLAAGLVALWLLVRILGRDGFAAYALALALAWILSVPASLGLDQLLLVRVATGRQALADAGVGLVRRAVLLVLLAGSAIAAALMLVAPAVARWSDVPGAGQWMAWLAPLVPLLAIAVVFECWFVALGRLWASQLFMAAGQALRLPLLLAVWLTGAGAWGVVATEMAVAALPVLLSLRASGWLRGGAGARFGPGAARPAAALMLAKLVSDGVKRGDLLLLGLLAPAAAVADYALASRFLVAVEAGRDLLQPGFTSRAGAALGRGDRAALRRDFTMVQSASLLVALGASAGLMLLGPFVLPLFGDFATAMAPLALLAAAALANVGSGPNSHLMKLTGHAGALLAIRLAAFGVLAGLTVALVPLAGAVGAGAALLAAHLAANLAFALLLYRRERLATLPAALAAVGLAGIGLLAATGLGLVPHVAAAAGLLLLALGVVLVEPLSWKPGLDAIGRLRPQRRG